MVILGPEIFFKRSKVLSPKLIERFRIFPVFKISALFKPFKILNYKDLMAKHLYLVRHAEAVPKEARQEDKTRELAQAGVKESLHLGAWLREKKTSFDLLVTSSAVRAEQTAALIAEGMKLENPRLKIEDVLYEASVRQLLDYINNIEDSYNQVLCVAHNPSASYLAEYLTKADVRDMAAGSLAIIDFDLNSWKLVSENSGVLRRYVTAESVARF